MKYNSCDKAEDRKPRVGQETARALILDFDANFRIFPTFMTTAVESNEIITVIEIPLWPAGHGYGFHEFARRRGDFAIVGAAALLDLARDETVRRAALALCGVANGPLRLAAAEQLLTGKRFDRAVAQAAAAAVKTITPVSDIHASADYRRHLAEVLVFRALRDAAARCGVRI